jgi:lysozyme family protein
MADYKKIIPFILQWEGGSGNDPDDAGGYTVKGVTIGTWKLKGYDNDHDGDIDAADLSKMTMEQWGMIFKYQFWNRVQGDSIKDQRMANMLVDWVWNSGSYATKAAQTVLNKLGNNLVVDGVFGQKTVNALNSVSPVDFCKLYHETRILFYEGLAARKPTQKKFLKGWKNRANALYNLPCS